MKSVKGFKMIKPKFIGIPKQSKPNTKIDKAVLKFARSKKHYIGVHGARAMNKWLPNDLDRPTNDWDLWAKNPDKAQDKLEDKLDDLAKSDMFYEEDIPISYAGTSKRGKVCAVKSKLTHETVAEFIEFPKGSGIYKMSGGIRWETLSHMKKIHQAILADPDVYEDRKKKSRRDLNRILEFERRRKR